MAHLGARKGHPVQKGPPRRDGWTKARRIAFLSHLIGTCNVEASCRAAGMSASAAYQLRRRDGEFARLWNETLAEGYVRLEAELLVRALGGASDPDNAIDLDAITDATLSSSDAGPGPSSDAGPGPSSDAGAGPASDVRSAGFDAALAMQLLAQKRAAEARGARYAKPFIAGSSEDTNAALERRLVAMEKRLAARS